MNFLLKTTIIIFLSSISALTTSAQSLEPLEEERTYPSYNYSIHGNYSSLVLSNQIFVGVERKIWQHNNFRTKAKVFYNSFLNNDFDFEANTKIYSSHLGLAAVQMISLFELNVGVAYSQYDIAGGFVSGVLGQSQGAIERKENQSGFDFYGSVGMRFEMNKFLIRFGVGNLDHLYFGIGFSF